MLYFTLLTSLTLILLLLRQKVGLPWIIHPRECTLRGSRRLFNINWISRRITRNCIHGRMNSSDLTQSPMSSQFMTAELGTSQSSLMGSQSDAIGCLSISPHSSMKMPAACCPGFWQTEMEKVSDTNKGASIALMCRSQGDPIAGRCITGATFVGPIQLKPQIWEYRFSAPDGLNGRQVFYYV